jgi:serine/tyrosine/threonine adenylyltransferase
MPPSPAYRPSTRHADLGEGFYDLVEAATFPQHILRHRNQRWAARVGLDTLTDEEWIAHFGRFEPLPGSFDRPMALRPNAHDIIRTWLFSRVVREHIENLQAKS